MSHRHGTRARSFQEAFDAAQTTSTSPLLHDQITTSIIEILSSTELKPAKKAKPSSRPVACCTCGPSSKCADRRCSCRRHKHQCTSCTSKRCTNSNDSNNDVNPSLVQQEEPTRPSPAQSTPSPLTQPTVTSVSDNAHARSAEADNSSNYSEFFSGSTQTLPSQFGGFPNHVYTPIDVKLVSLFDGEHLRNNDGIHLDGDMSDYEVCQDRCRRVIVHPLTICDLPSGPVGRSSIKILCEELKRVVERSWNFDKALCFIS